jgi:hypothetical protein
MLCEHRILGTKSEGLCGSTDREHLALLLARDKIRVAHLAVFGCFALSSKPYQQRLP